MDVPLHVPDPLEGDDNGYHAWLRYSPETEPTRRKWILARLGSLSGAIPAAAESELVRFLEVATGQSPQRCQSRGKLHFELDHSRDDLGPEGYSIDFREDRFIITASAEAGLIYGAFSLIERIRLGDNEESLVGTSAPACPLRVLNHWDDPKFDHTLGPYNVTRGFAGNSIFFWTDLQRDHPRYIDYARMLASIRINAVCLNNVNADPDVLETSFLPGIRAMADRFRPYNIRIFLAVPFTAPMVCDGELSDEEYGDGYPFCMRNRKIRLGTLGTADPSEPEVQAWWRLKADEIYDLIPDFGGFVIKANSEGMPGPQDYDRTHAEGANCLARALAPHGGLLFYRTFVYHGADKSASPQSQKFDGNCQPYLEFVPLDGEFDDNVILQTKCGPADFRAHEPPSPLLGAVPGTRQAIEFMVAQEYLGHTTHVCFQGHDWKNTLNFDTHHQGEGTLIGQVVSGALEPYQAGAVVGVANTGDDPNWFGHLLAGANLYAFGRLAWNWRMAMEEIVDRWTRLTFGGDQPEVIQVTKDILYQSYEVYARYSVPLGMNYMFERNHHFEPNIKALSELNWNRNGAGYDRTIRSGTRFLEQYHPNARTKWENPETTPIEQLLFFHHLPWDYPVKGTCSLAEYIRKDRLEAVEVVREWLEAWRKLKNNLNPQLWAHVYERLQRQYVHAGKWRDAGLEALRSVGQLEADTPATSSRFPAVLNETANDSSSPITLKND